MPASGALRYVKDRQISARRLGPWMNMKELRSWIDFCEQHHVDHCQFSARSKSLFVHRPRRLIDVNGMCLVPAEPEHRYLALSYVWGTGKSFKTLKSNIDRLQQDGALDLSKTPSDQNVITLPQTIRDV